MSSASSMPPPSALQNQSSPRTGQQSKLKKSPGGQPKPNYSNNKELLTPENSLSSDNHNDSGYETHGQQTSNLRENSSESGDSLDQRVPNKSKPASKKKDDNSQPPFSKNQNLNGNPPQQHQRLNNSGDSDLYDENRYELVQDNHDIQKPAKARLKTAKTRKPPNVTSNESSDARGNFSNGIEPLPNSVAGSNTSIRSRGSDSSTDKKVSFKEDLLFDSGSNGKQINNKPENKTSPSIENSSPKRKPTANGSLTARESHSAKNSETLNSKVPLTARERPLSDISKEGSNNNSSNNNSNTTTNNSSKMADGSRNFKADEEFAMWQRVSRNGSGKDLSDTISIESTRSGRLLERQGWASNRDDSGYETYGRKFTRKGTKNNLGSSTTLSSTNEGDDNDDVFNVVLRVRPLNDQENLRKDKFVADFPGDGQVSVNNSGTNRNFQFNVVFEPDADQEDVFESSGIKKLVENSLSGYSCTAFAFGQTGSGKTHTMTGPPAQFHQEGVTPDPSMYGLMQRSFKYLFQLLKKQGPKIVRASYMEVYNEQVIDLLNNSHKRYLAVRWSKNRGFYVENLFTVECTEIDDLMAVLEEGLRNRQTGSHGLNEFSSRSHSVLTVTIDSETQAEGGEDDNLYITKRGKLSFVDLAGSEKVKDANSTNGGPRMDESNSINKSLLVLGNCISHLGDPKRRQGHIPYRDSKLTKLLADSLGGNGITLMIACITPSSSNTTETLNTLRYASRAKKIKTRPTVKMDPREKLILTLKKEIKVLRNENHYLRQQLDFPAKPKGQLQKENDEKFMKFMKETQQKESGMYEMLQEYMVENEALRAENNEIQGIKDKTRREQQVLNRENEKLAKRVEELERIISEHPSTWALLDHHRRTDGYSQNDLSPRGSPVAYYSPSGKPIRPTDIPISSKPKVGSPHGHAKKPPHRLQDHVTRPAPRPIDYVEEGYATNGYMSPRQTSLTSVKGPGSPHQVDRKASQVSQTDVIRANNEKLKKDLLQLEGEIVQHARIAQTNTHMKFIR